VSPKYKTGAVVDKGMTQPAALRRLDIMKTKMEGAQRAEDKA